MATVPCCQLHCSQFTEGTVNKTRRHNEPCPRWQASAEVWTPAVSWGAQNQSLCPLGVLCSLGSGLPNPVTLMKLRYKMRAVVERENQNDILQCVSDFLLIPNTKHKTDFFFVVSLFGLLLLLLARIGAQHKAVGSIPSREKQQKQKICCFW